MTTRKSNSNTVVPGKKQVVVGQTRAIRGQTIVTHPAWSGRWTTRAFGFYLGFWRGWIEDGRQTTLEKTTTFHSVNQHTMIGTTEKIKKIEKIEQDQLTIATPVTMTRTASRVGPKK